MTAQFAFLAPDFPELRGLAAKVERYAMDDPAVAVIYARKTLEHAVRWMYDVDRQLARPYDDSLNALINTPDFRALANGLPAKAANKIRREGNRAAHDAAAPGHYIAVEVASALWHFAKWFAITYGQTKPDPALTFDARSLAQQADVEVRQRSKAEREALEAQLDEEQATKAEVARRHDELALTVEQLEARNAELLAQVAAAKKAAAQTIPDDAVDWSELETRQFLIDLLLREAGWDPDAPHVREHPVTGMPSPSGTGKVDYVLWGADGRPLAVIEAKKTLVSPQSGQQQAKLYADCLEAVHGQRSVILTSNGYEHWLWDDAFYPPRQVQGFPTADELALAVQRRTTRQPLAEIDLDTAIVERYYQHRAIRAIADHLDTDRQRKALLVMATGSGKTRTVIALTDLLMRAGWVKRVLFLADRTALVSQAVNAFKQHLPDAAPVNLVTEPHADGRVYVSTYQTMVGKIDELRPDRTRRFGVGHFDLVVIDEAHRSVYRKYRGIFEYFDSLLVGLTATPKEEVDKNTYDLFELETGVPTDAYSLDEAIDDGFLVPPKAVSVPLKFVREGLRYDDLSADERAQWEEMDWGTDEDGNPLDPPDDVSAAVVNKFLFNTDTVDKVLAHLMTDGIKVAGGDRLGKTIIFAKNQRHADFISQRFDANYPHHAGTFARVITHDVRYGQSLIEDFSVADKAPHIAISVDMLDTGIDVPEVVNLVFFKLVRSKTKFWQMLGRGTRLCPDLFGPEDDKTEFRVFDFCQNLEFFSQDIAAAETLSGMSLKEQIFRTRLDLLVEIDAHQPDSAARDVVVGDLVVTIDSMNTDNFLVRPHRKLVEQFAAPAAWDDLTLTDHAALARRVAGLPDQLQAEHVDARRFDVMILTGQLALLRGEPFEAVRRRIVEIAGALEDQHQNIPAIAARLPLIQAIQADEWWVDVTFGMLEEVRRDLRGLVPLIERSRKHIVYSSFTDTIGAATEVELPAAVSDFAQFRKKAEAFLKDHLGDAVVAKVRGGATLTPADIDELQRILVAAGVGNHDSFAVASAKAGSFGLFIRSLVGLDRAAAKAALGEFLDDKRYTANQIRFVTMVIDELTARGAMDKARIYESPYDHLAPQGPEDLFDDADLDRLFDALESLTRAAAVNPETTA